MDMNIFSALNHHHTAAFTPPCQGPPLSSLLRPSQSQLPCLCPSSIPPTSRLLDKVMSNAPVVLDFDQANCGRGSWSWGGPSASTRSRDSNQCFVGLSWSVHAAGTFIAGKAWILNLSMGTWKWSLSATVLAGGWSASAIRSWQDIVAHKTVFGRQFGRYEMIDGAGLAQPLFIAGVHF